MRLLWLIICYIMALKMKISAEQPVETGDSNDLVRFSADSKDSSLGTSGLAAIPLQQALKSSLWLPNDVWHHHILSRLGYTAVAFFSQSFRYANQVATSSIIKMFQSVDLDMPSLLRRAHTEGVKLNIPLLYRLCNLPNAGELFYMLLPEENPSWALAAICGDIDWLLGKYGKDFINIVTKPFDPPLGILYFIAMGGHLNIIEQYFEGILQQYNRSPNKQQIRQINYIAGRVGKFLICDYLEKKFQVEPNESFENKQSTIHFYAYYGELERLKAALRKYPEIEFKRNEQTGYLIHDAVRGGDLRTFDFLAKKSKKMVLTTLPRNNKKNCLHLAAEFAHAELLLRLLTEFPLKPCAGDNGGLTPLHYSTTLGRWDCFNILKKHYKDHPKYLEIIATAGHQAVALNHMDFFDQYILRFGNSCISAKTPMGTPLAHQLLGSRNMRTARKLVNEYGVDLMATNNEGENTVLFIARIAVEKKIPIWHFIAELLSEFNPKYDNKLHLTSDKAGNTLDHWIARAEKQAMFQNLHSPDSTIADISITN